MHFTKIGDLVGEVEKWNPARDAPDINLQYVDLFAVCRKSKIIESVTYILGRDAPSRARQKLNTDDVIISTVRPNLNSVAYVGAKFNSATASTGFCILRPNKKRLSPRYLFQWL